MDLWGGNFRFVLSNLVEQIHFTGFFLKLKLVVRGVRGLLSLTKKAESFARGSDDSL